MLTGLPVMLLAYPEMFLLAAGCAILVIDLFLKDATRWVTYALSLAALLGCAFLTLIVIPVVYSLLKRRGRKPPEQANGHREVAPGAVWEYFRPRPEQPVP